MRRELGAALALLLAGAAPAAAKPQGEPVRFWSIADVRQGVGAQTVTSGSQLGEVLRKTADLGPAAFNFTVSPFDGRAAGEVFSSADGRTYSVLAQAPVLNPFLPSSPKGGTAHLEELQAYEKRSHDASLTITLNHTRLETIDANFQPSRRECPVPSSCRPLRSLLRFRARAYAESASGDFYSVGGSAFIVGRQGHWGADAVTAADSQRRLWDLDDWFRIHAEDGSFATMQLDGLSLRVPLRGVREGELFAVDVSLDAVAIDGLGGESAVEAAIQDPQDLAGRPLLTARGLKPLGRPRFKAPKVRPPRPAHCRRHLRRAGTLELAEPAGESGEETGTPLVVVRRTGGKRGAASAVIGTRGASARAGRDFIRRKVRVHFGDGDDSPRLVEIPIREDGVQEPRETLTATLAQARCAKLGRHQATVTIVDDDAPPAQPPAPPGGPVPTATPTPAPPPASAGFGDGGRVSTSLGGEGEGEGVVIQPDGTIVTAGRAATPSGFDFALTRHDDAGGLEGITTTDLGTQDDEASAVALTPDGGLVAAGRTLSGPVDYDVALVRYRPDGSVDTGFAGHGIVKTDVAGSGDVAQDVAVQPDGKIVVAGSSASGVLADGDVLLARYLPDGRPDPGFGGGDGIVTTDLGTRADGARALVVRPDGTIVVAGTAGEDVALVRYLADGTPDGAPTISDFGSDDVADGVALAPDGSILVAGFTLGPSANRDFLLARYSAGGVLERSVTTDFGGGDDFGRDLVVDGAGRIVVTGQAASATLFDLALARYGPDLRLDPAFAGDGTLTVDFHGRGDSGEDVALDRAGRIVAAGFTGTGTETDFALLRASP
jgi:uncharacterized delta-60 repeat protein